MFRYNPPVISQTFIFTKILATVGPSSQSVEVLERLIEEGVRVFRLNFSHGSFESFAAMLANIRKAEEAVGQPVAVLGDLCGPKIRVGKVAEGGIELQPGQHVVFQRQDIVAQPVSDPTEPVVFSTTFPPLIDDVQPGQRLLVDDGNVRMLVLDHVGEGEDRKLVCSVTVGGLVTTRKGINLPDTDLNVPSITDYDWQCAAWAIENEVDYLALSFVRQASDVNELKRYLHANRKADGRAIPVIAKIEMPQAIRHLEAIVREADGVMVARGDLGVEMDLAQVPIIQKQIIRLAHDYGKPVIVATQMLQSMIDAPTPTRAEVSDVANAIYDGADAVMLSGETAVGKYPVQAVHTMARIAVATEADMRANSSDWDRPPRKLQETRYRTAALAHGVSVVVRDLDAKLVITWSQNAGGARYLSQNRLHVPIIAASSNPAALRHMCLMFGVCPIALKPPADAEQFIALMDQVILDRAWANPGDAAVYVMGETLGISGITNKLQIHYIGDVCRL